MYQANVYTIMIGAPSDVDDEIKAAFEIVYKWNNINSLSHKIVLMPSHWSTHSIPTLKLKPQKAIDEQVVGKSDMLICIFGSKLGTPTDDYLSGTVEEIEEHLKAGKEVMTFFCKSIDTSKTSPEQISKLLQYKDELFKKGLCAEYSDVDDFSNVLFEKLSLNMNTYFFGYGVQNEIYLQSVPTLPNISILSQSDIDSLKDWIESEDEDAHSIDFMGNSSTVILGRKQISVQSAREKVAWNGFFERLLKLDFIEIYGYTNKQNKPKYRLKEAAYNFIDSLE